LLDYGKGKRFTCLQASKIAVVAQLFMTKYLVIYTNNHKVKQSNIKTAYEIFFNRSGEPSSIFEITPTQVQQVQTITKKGKKITHTISQWDNLLLRTKKGKKMSDKLLNLLAVVSIDRTYAKL